MSRTVFIISTIMMASVTRTAMLMKNTLPSGRQMLALMSNFPQDGAIKKGREYHGRAAKRQKRGMTQPISGSTASGGISISYQGMRTEEDLRFKERNPRSSAGVCPVE